MRKFIVSFILTSSFSIVVSQTVPKATGSALTQEDAQSALDFHNKVRKDVGAPALQWSAELSAYAQAWADNLAKNNGCKMQHRPDKGEWAQVHGENIFWGSGGNYSPLDASKEWYSEIKDYKHGPISDINWPVAGHYTQMVWKNTTHVGIGMATCSGGQIIIVGNYNPPGNYWGEKPY